MTNIKEKIGGAVCHVYLTIVPGRNSNYINSSRGNNVGNFMPNSL